MNRLIYAAAIAILMTLGACTGNLTHDEPYRSIAGEDLVLLDEPLKWVLMNNRPASITTHSEGNRLYLVPDSELTRHLEPGPANQSRFVALGKGARIKVSRFREYGMETWHPVALGVITLIDGRILPFEAEWRSHYFDQVQVVDESVN